MNKKQHPQVTRENRQPPINSSTFRAVLWLSVRQDIPEGLHNSQTLCQQFSHAGSLQNPWRPKSQVMLPASHTAPSSHKVTKKQTVQWDCKLDTAFWSWTRLLLVLPVRSIQPWFWGYSFAFCTWGLPPVRAKKREDQHDKNECKPCQWKHYLNGWIVSPTLVRAGLYKKTWRTNTKLWF